jgi:hypothetical protein
VNLLGEIGEVAFLHKAMTVGLVVAKPYGHINRFDFIVEARGHLWRVQVKAGGSQRFGLYALSTRCHRGGLSVSYSVSEVDFLAAYIVPEDSWVILPAVVTANHETLMIRPKGYVHGDPYAEYREAWHLFWEPDGVWIG